MRFIVFLVSLLLLLGMSTSNSTQSQTCVEFDASELIGCWQDAPEPYAGLADCYNFYENHTFRFIYNQMTPFDRRLYMDGTWEIVDNAEIRIYLESLTYLDGGNIAYYDYRGYYIDGGTPRTEKIEPHWIWNFDIDKLNLHLDEWYGVKDYQCDFSANGEYYEPSDDGVARKPLRKLEAAFFSKTQCWKIYDLPYYRNEEEKKQFMDSMSD